MVSTTNPCVFRSYVHTCSVAISSRVDCDYNARCICTYISTMQIIKRKPGASKALYQIDPEPYERKPIKGRIAIADSETDPFLEGRVVAPFTCGYYVPDIDAYWDFWGADCFTQMFDHIDETFPNEKLTFFGHNWGGFDVYFTTNEFDEGMKPFIKNGRLSSVTCRGHTYRDSYDLIPVKLADALSAEDGGKIEINYAKMEAVYDPGTDYPTSDTYDARGAAIAATGVTTRKYHPRDYYRAEIRHYQEQDCRALGKLVVAWLEAFGDRPSMASVALPMLRSFHGFETLSESLDQALRAYYFGGRCEAFEHGIIDGSFVGFDINSSYPDVMRRVLHPISDTPVWEKRISGKTHFARIRAWSNGALPVRTKDGGIDFPVGTRDFFACIHEIRAGLETGTLRIHHVYESMYFKVETTFAAFIDRFYALRMEADASGDTVMKLFYKLVMNSSYGKFAQDPRKYEKWWFDPPSIPHPVFCGICNEGMKDDKGYTPCAKCAAGETDPYGWYCHTEREGKLIYARPQALFGGRGFFNVATAASITSAARASLLYAINGCKRPIYCDTDSLICEALEPDTGGRIVLDAKTLGAWKQEFSADRIAVAGKKLYGVFDRGECVKTASKGVKLTGEEILRICGGETITYASPVPKMSLFKDEGKGVIRVNEMVSARFITRRISATHGKVYEYE